MSPPPWQTGDRLMHRLNPDLGPGRVTAVNGRTLSVVFPFAGTSLPIVAAVTGTNRDRRLVNEGFVGIHRLIAVSRGSAGWRRCD